MSGFTLTEWINQSPEAVFDFAINPENASKVIEGVTKMEQISSGPVGVGTRFREARVVNGKEAMAEMELTSYEPPRSYQMTSEMKGIVVSYRYDLVPENGGTRVNLVCDVSAKGLKKLAAPMVASIMKKEDGDHLQNLKAAMGG